MRSRVALILVILGLAMAVIAAPVAAASLTVNSTADTAPADDGSCTLREAITAANSDTASGASAGECAAGSGADTITFSVAGTITLLSALPAITTELTIAGAGAITVSGASANRVFLVSATGAVTLSGLTITAGSAALGGGIYNNNGTLTVTNSTISGNSAISGGGILNLGSLTVTNSTISGNTAASLGGGIANLPGHTLTVTNSTLSGNSAGNGGGGIFAAGTETVVNSIIAGNSAPVGPDIDAVAETLTTSLTGAATGILVPAGLANNGGPTQTIALALVAANPAIDTGTSATCAAAPVNGLDQRGLPRPTACDIGAYEAQPPTLAAHANVTAPATSAAGAVVSYTPPTATDEQGGVASVACLPASGATFPIGTTTVTCTATDAVGHTASSTFSVTVGAFTPTPAASLVNAAMAQSGPSSPLATLGFAALLIGALGTLAVVSGRRAVRRR